MNYRNKIPIIDLFAGPGGLGEGFMSLKSNEGKSIFDIKLSIEKNVNAHKTLALRSFFRQFDHFDFLNSPRAPVSLASICGLSLLGSEGTAKRFLEVCIGRVILHGIQKRLSSCLS